MPRVGAEPVRRGRNERGCPVAESGPESRMRIAPRPEELVRALVRHCPCYTHASIETNIFTNILVSVGIVF